MTSSLCREHIIIYFSKFPLKGLKNVYYKRWVRIHGYQQRGLRLTSRSATKLQHLVLALEEQPLEEYFNIYYDRLKDYLLSEYDSPDDYLISNGIIDNIAKIRIAKNVEKSSNLTNFLETPGKS